LNLVIVVLSEELLEEEGAVPPHLNTK